MIALSCIVREIPTYLAGHNTQYFLQTDHRELSRKFFPDSIHTSTH